METIVLEIAAGAALVTVCLLFIVIAVFAAFGPREM